MKRSQWILFWFLGLGLAGCATDSWERAMWEDFSKEPTSLYIDIEGGAEPRTLRKRSGSKAPISTQEVKKGSKGQRGVASWDSGERKRGWRRKKRERRKKGLQARLTHIQIQEQSQLNNNAASLWKARGQDFYLFSKNTLRVAGDRVSIQVAEELKKQIELKLNVIQDLMDRIEEEKVRKQISLTRKKAMENYQVFLENYWQARAEAERQAQKQFAKGLSEKPNVSPTEKEEQEEKRKMAALPSEESSVENPSPQGKVPGANVPSANPDEKTSLQSGAKKDQAVNLALKTSSPKTSVKEESKKNSSEVPVALETVSLGKPKNNNSELKEDREKDSTAYVQPVQSSKKWPAPSLSLESFMPKAPPPVASKVKRDSFDVQTIHAHVHKVLKDGNYLIRGHRPLIVGNQDYKLTVEGVIRQEDFEDEGVSSDLLMDSYFDIVKVDSWNSKILESAKGVDEKSSAPSMGLGDREERVQL